MSKKYTKILLAVAIIICALFFVQSTQQIYAAPNVISKPSAITSLYLHSAGKQQATVKWSTATNFDKYELTLTEQNGTTRTHIYESTVTAATLNNLKPNTNYIVGIRAYKNIQRKEYFNSTTQQWQLTQPEAKDWANKRNRTVTIREYGTSAPLLMFTTKYDCKGVHTGGTATCVSRATCTRCGEKYGQFTSTHSLYFSGNAADRKLVNSDEISATEYQTYRCRHCKYTETRIVRHRHYWDMIGMKYGPEQDGWCEQITTYKCTSCKKLMDIKQTINADDRIRTDNKDAAAKTKAMLNGQNKYMGIYANDVDVTLTKYKYGFNTIGWSEALDGKIRSDTKLSKCLDDEKLVPFINLLPNKCKLSDIAQGKYDHYLVNFFNRVYSENRTGKVFVCFAPEMEMRPSETTAINDWQAKSPAAFIAAWKHVVEMGRTFAPNIVWVWSPNMADKYARDYYPGSEYVDCVSVTLNDPTLSDGTFEAYYKTKGIKKNVESYGKPILISSAACGFTDATKQKNYLTGMINYMQSDPAIVGGVIMDSDVDANHQYKFSDIGNTVYALSVTLGKYKKYEIPARTVDWTTINASENKMVYNVQLQTGSNKKEFLKWYNGLGLDITNNKSDWSTILVSWAAQQAGLSKDNVPIVDTPQKMIDFYKAKGTYYHGRNNCWPLTGDIIIFDDNFDGTPDRIGLVEYCNFDAGNLVIIGGNMLNSITDEYVVATESCKTSDKRIYGYCKPENTVTKIKYNQYSSTFKRNGLDTVCAITKESYVKTIADDGIEVVARYINPDGRTPLTREEAQLFSNYGVRLMMIYQVGTEDPYKGYDKGYSFGTKALQYATDIGAPKGTPIFFCCDGEDKALQRYQLARFIKGVRDAMGDNYSVGMYGPYKTVQALYNAGLIDAVWQCFGYSDNYVSDNFDAFQWSQSTYFYDNIPYPFDANDIKDVEKVSFILPYKELN
jgi:hypothetical protein